MNSYVGAILWSLFSIFCYPSEISKRNKIKPDAAIGLVTTAISFLFWCFRMVTDRYTRNFESLLFGNILSISDQDLYAIILITVFVDCSFSCFIKQLVFYILTTKAQNSWNRPAVELLFSFSNDHYIFMSSIGAKDNFLLQ